MHRFARWRDLFDGREAGHSQANGAFRSRNRQAMTCPHRLQGPPHTRSGSEEILLDAGLLEQVVAAGLKLETQLGDIVAD
jgi:hypothetical protein